MATLPAPTPDPDPNRRKTDFTEAVETSIKQPDFQLIRNDSKGSDVQNYFHAAMKKRWLRVTVIAVAVLILVGYRLGQGANRQRCQGTGARE